MDSVSDGNVIAPGIYRHFKGREYEVLCTATDSENGEAMVVYKAMYGDGKVWVRPARMWNEITSCGISRFTRISAGNAEIVYSDEYEDYICSACGELMPLTVFRFCPYCGRPFKERKVHGE